MFIKYKMRCLVVRKKKKIYYSCEGKVEKSITRDHRLPSLGKPCDANQ